MSILLSVLFQSHLLRNDRRGTYDKVWAQFLVCMGPCISGQVGKTFQNNVISINMLICFVFQKE